MSSDSVSGSGAVIGLGVTCGCLAALLFLVTALLVWIAVSQKRFTLYSAFSDSIIYFI